MNSEKRTPILVINYYWPPSGGPAVQRWLKFTELLADRGFEPHVLTVDENYATYPFIDESLNNQVDDRVKVHKTKTAELLWLYKKTVGRGSVPGSAFVNESNPGPLKKFSRFIRGNFFIPDPRKGWNKYAINRAKAVIKEYGISVVVTAGPPHSTHLIGKKLKKLISVQWVADFHDYWTDISYYDMFYKTPFSKYLDAKLERQVLESCDKVTTHCLSSKRILTQKMRKPDEDKVKVITMAYDEKLMDQASYPPFSEFRITYTGTIADFYEPEILFRVFSRIREQYPDFNIKVQFVGVVGANVERLIHRWNLSDVVEQIGYVSKKTSVEYLMVSTVLIMINPFFKNEKFTVPGKIYEYLASQKPIINIAPINGETAEIIQACNAGQTFERHMDEALFHYLKKLYQSWKNNPDLDIKGNEECIQKYSYKNEGDKLAQILRSLPFEMN